MARRGVASATNRHSPMRLILIRVEGHGHRDPVTGRRLYFAHRGGLEHLQLTDESEKVRNVKYKLIEERYVDLVKKRRIEFGHEVLQILASTSEIETRKGREGITRQGCRASISSIVTSRMWGVEVNTEEPEMGQLR